MNAIQQPAKNTSTIQTTPAKVSQTANQTIVLTTSDKTVNTTLENSIFTTATTVVDATLITHHVANDGSHNNNTCQVVVEERELSENKDSITTSATTPISQGQSEEQHIEEIPLEKHHSDCPEESQERKNDDVMLVSKPRNRRSRGTEGGVAKPRSRKKTTLTETLTQTLFNLYLNSEMQRIVDDISIKSNSLMESRLVVFQRVRCLINNYNCTVTRMRMGYMGHSVAMSVIDARLFGSNAVGLALPSSDIDILLAGMRFDSRENVIHLLQHLLTTLKSMKWVVSAVSYFSAKIPIIKLEIDPRIGFFASVSEEIPYGRASAQSNLELRSSFYPPGQCDSTGGIIKVDITVDGNPSNSSDGFLSPTQHVGCRTTELMKYWLERYEGISSLVILMKQILHSREYNHSFTGGLSSYSVFIMVTAYLKEFYFCNKKYSSTDGNNTTQNQKKAVQSGQRNKTVPHPSEAPTTQEPVVFEVKGMGELIYDIMYYYAYTFNNTTTIITLSEESTCFRPLVSEQFVCSCGILELSEEQTSSSDNECRCFVIIDPVHNRSITANCTLFYEIRNLFREILQKLDSCRGIILKEVQKLPSNDAKSLSENKKKADKFMKKKFDEGVEGEELKEIMGFIRKDIFEV